MLLSFSLPVKTSNFLAQRPARSAARAASSSRPRSVAVRAEAKANEKAAAFLEKYDEIVCDLSAYPAAKFFRVEAIVRPWRAPTVVKALQEAGIRGLTVCQVQGAGVQGGVKERYGGSEFGLARLVEKTRLDIVLNRDQVDAVVRIICKSAATGEIGDGKIFVSPVAEVVRVRTAETGAVAEKMMGGMEDMTNKA